MREGGQWQRTLALFDELPAKGLAPSAATLNYKVSVL
jgi:hypothetical protein